MNRKISPMRARRSCLSEASVAVQRAKKRNTRPFQNNNQGQKEGKLASDYEKAMTRVSYYPTMDTYGHMRAMILAASLPEDPHIENSSISKDHPLSIGYSDVDQDIINAAAKLCGFPIKPMAGRYSKESEHVHRHSPTNHNSGRHPS